MFSSRNKHFFPELSSKPTLSGTPHLEIFIKRGKKPRSYLELSIKYGLSAMKWSSHICEFTGRNSGSSR